MSEEYLPGTAGERIRDLRRQNNMTQEEFADAIGISKSTVVRIEKDSKLNADDALEIAKFFNVSVDFVLGNTDYPKVVNYDLKVLGLTPEAAEKLYTGQVDTGVLNLIIEHDRCSDLMKLIMFYINDITAEASRLMNTIYEQCADMLRQYGDNEDADAIASKTEPVYSSDISKIHNCLGIILRDTKQKIGSNDKKFYKETKATVAQLIKDTMRTNAAMRKIKADEYASFVVNLISSRLSLPEEIAGNLHDALVPIFKLDSRGAKK